jgi:hypothetical protein
MTIQDINKLIDIISKQIYKNKIGTNLIITSQSGTKELKFSIEEYYIPNTSIKLICIRYWCEPSMKVEQYLDTIVPKDAKLTYEEARKQMSEILAKDFIDKILSKLVMEVKLALADKRVEDLLNEI